MNKLCLMGRVVANPELTVTTSNVSVCKFTLAVKRMKKSKNASVDTDFFDIVVWKGLAENCARYLQKGDKAGVCGELHINKFVGNDGQKKVKVEVTADDVDFISKASVDEHGIINEPVNGGFVECSDEILPF